MHKISRRRLDAEMVSRGLANSREHAVDLISRREVTVSGAPAMKPSRQVSPGEPIIVTGPPPRFVSRAGVKLEAAISAFGLDVSHAVCVDVGSSTGGFTDCLLQNGARSVLAVDVGTNQLHTKLRSHPSVEVREQTDIRSIALMDFADDPQRSDGFDVLVADLSFISTANLLPIFASLLRPSGFAVTLIKPQFEAGKREVSRGKGVIADPTIWVRVLHEFIDAASDAGIPVQNLALSPIRGGKGKGNGNVEFLALLRPANTAPDSSSLTDAKTYLGHDD